MKLSVYHYMHNICMATYILVIQNKEFRRKLQSYQYMHGNCNLMGPADFNTTLWAHVVGILFTNDLNRTYISFVGKICP